IFIDTAYRSFERAYPKCNDVFIFTKKPWQFIKNNDLFIETSKLEALNPFFAKSLWKYEIIVLHSLANFMIPIVLMPKRAKIIWLGMGYDYYSRAFSADTLDVGLYLDETRRIINDEISPRININSIRSRFKNLLNRVLGSKTLFRWALNEIDIFSPVLPVEYNMVKNKFNVKSFPKYAPWNYGNLENDFVRNFIGKRVSGDWILLGNSAGATNNHLEAIKILSKLDLNPSKYKIVTPLSYGDNNYAKIIKDYGTANLGESFCPIEKFMPIDDYIELLQKCGFVIMNHVRQQAMGNIIIMMYLGAKVFLRSESAIYTFFKGLGATIYSVEELELNKKLLNSKLELDEIINNREILSSYFSENADL
ncbi:TPA: TDP-N-acetylfucosamine:lipid II N-acetylfucosaminyltransferase, partial [Aeromonas hydrophila]